MNYVDASNVKLSILQRIWKMEAGHLIALKAFQPLVVNSFYILLTSSCSFFPPGKQGGDVELYTDGVAWLMDDFKSSLSRFQLRPASSMALSRNNGT